MNHIRLVVRLSIAMDKGLTREEIEQELGYLGDDAAYNELYAIINKKREMIKAKIALRKIPKSKWIYVNPKCKK